MSVVLRVVWWSRGAGRVYAGVWCVDEWKINQRTDQSKTQSTHQLKLQSIGNGTTEKQRKPNQKFHTKGATVTFIMGAKSYTKTLATKKKKNGNQTNNAQTKGEELQANNGENKQTQTHTLAHICTAPKYAESNSKNREISRKIPK